MIKKDFSVYAPTVLRLALSAVYVWFGTSQLINTNAWTGLVPDLATSLSGMDASTIIHFNGVFEIIAGTLLAMGICVRWIALLLAVHLLGIASSLGLTAVAVRDFGLSFATFAIALFGSDQYCLMQPKKQDEI